MTDMAVPADNIDEAQAEEARQRAEARLHEKLSSEEVASVNAALARSLAQLLLSDAIASPEDPGSTMTVGRALAKGK